MRSAQIETGRRAVQPALLAAAMGVVAAVAWWQFLAGFFWPTATEVPWRGPGYWVAARLAYAGRGDLVYGRPEEFNAAAARLGAVPDIFEPNVPTTLLAFLPIAGMTFGEARVWWAFFILGCLVAAWALLVWALRLPLWMWLGLSAVLTLMEPVRRNMYIGQVYYITLLTVVVGSVLAARTEGMEGGRRKALYAAGAAVGFALTTVVKLFYGGVGLMAALARRRVWVVAGAGVLFAGAALLTLAWVRPEAWTESLAVSATWRDRPEAAITAYQTVNGLLTHLLRYHEPLNPAPVVDWPWLVGPLWWVTLVGVLGVSGWAAVRHNVEDGGEGARAWGLMPYALALPVGLLLSPSTEDYHFTMAVFPLMVTLAVLWHERSKVVGAWVVLAAAWVLLSWPWRFYNVPGADGWSALLFYPRVYGTLLLWGLMVWLMWRRGREAKEGQAGLERGRG